MGYKGKWRKMKTKKWLYGNKEKTIASCIVRRKKMKHKINKIIIINLKHSNNGYIKIQIGKVKQKK